MSAEGSSNDDSLIECFKKICASKNAQIWKDFELWMKEDPSVRRKDFKKIICAMNINMNFADKVYYHIFGTPESAFGNFCDVANDAGFVTGNGERCHQKLNVFTMLAELFATHPEYKGEGGPLLLHIQRHLNLLLPPELGWRKLVIDPRIFRPLYYQLIKTFELNLEDDDDDSSSSDSNTSDKPKKSQLLFASFVVSIMVAIWCEHSLMVSALLPEFRNLTLVENLLEALINSAYFRILSTFLLIGFSLILQYRREGGIVTQSEKRPYPAEKAIADEREFQRRVSTFTPSSFDFKLEGEDIESQQCQIFWIRFLRNTLLTPPEPIAQKPTGIAGKSRKSGVNKRRNSLEDYGSPRKMPRKTNEKSPTKKKDMRKSNRREREDSEDVARSRSSSPTPAPEPVPSPKNVAAGDLGLLEPVYAMQMEQVRWFLAEVERRKREGVTDEDRQRLKDKVKTDYDDMQRLSDLSMSCEPMKLNKDQQAMMNHFKRTWRQVNPEQFVLHSTKEHKNVEIPIKKKNLTSTPSTSSTNISVATSSTSKTGKKWKRYY